MYSPQDLNEEIKSIIDRTIGAGQRVRSAWITTELANAHPDHSGEDREFWELTGIHGLNAKVRAFVNSLKSDEEDPGKQDDLPFAMPGYKHLQKFYFVSDPANPEEDSVGIPVDKMTDEQLELKAREYDKMATGCTAHADELRRYARNRSVSA